jgi:WD40 repeat protein
VALMMLGLFLPVEAARSAEPRSTLEGHSKSVWSVAFTADGKTLASGGDDETVKLWDVAELFEKKAGK